jgi:hypothetical protein
MAKDYIKIIEDALRTGGPKPRVVRAGSFKDLGNLLGLPDCGEKDCPIHSDEPEPNRDDVLLTAEDLQFLGPKEALQGAIGATGTAHNHLIRKEYRAAKREQEQAFLWIRLRETLQEQLVQDRIEEDRKAYEARLKDEPDSRNEDEPVS